jgi:hypothetical protein
MPRNGSGAMSVLNTFSPGTTISSAAVNATLADLAAEITNSDTRNGAVERTGLANLGANHIQASSKATPSTPAAGKSIVYWRSIGGIAMPRALLSNGVEHDLLSYRITPHMSGAKGDGVTDDTAALAAALTAATGKTLWVPDGTYLLASGLTIPDNTAVILSSNAVLRATGAMDAILQTDQAVEHKNNIIEGGFLDCNSLAVSGIWLKWFSKFTIEDVEILDHKGPNGAIRLGRTAGTSSYEAFIQDVRVNRLDGVAPADSKGVEFENAGDSHLSDVVIVGQQYGVYGAYNDSKLTRVHVWNYGPDHGSLVVGFHCLGVDAVHVQCQVDGPASSNCFYAGGARLVYLGCATNNPAAADGGTDQTAGCVFVDAGASATIMGCTFKGSADARWASDISGTGTIKALHNHAIHTTSVYGDTRPGVSAIASGSLSGTDIVIPDIPANFSALQLQISGASCDTASRHLLIQVSTDNGSSWDTTSTNYIGFTVAGATVAAITEATLAQTADAAAAAVHTAGLVLTGYANAGHMTATGRISNGSTNYSVQCTNAKALAVNAIRILWSGGGGNFDAGTYALEGIA